VHGPGEGLYSELAIADPLVADVRDLAWAARFLEDRLGSATGYVGLWGGSRGAGTMLRALTALRAGIGFPESERYAFAFGIAQGLGDVVPLDPSAPGYQSRARMFGRLLSDTAALRERAPFRYVHLLDAPVLFLHGTDDPTAEIGRTRNRVIGAQRSGVPLTWVEFPGEGHNFATLSANVALYREQFAFLERFLKELRE
jgi:pimeloyl-ACP methyl ester carboxylesterase